MSDQRDELSSDETGLEFFETEQLIQELRKRFDYFLLTTVSNKTDRDYLLETRWQGPRYVMFGLLEETKNQIRESDDQIVDEGDG